MKPLPCPTPGCGEQLQAKANKYGNPGFSCEECGVQIQFRTVRGRKMLIKALGPLDGAAPAAPPAKTEGSQDPPARTAPASPPPADDQKKGRGFRFPFEKR